jgi:hypothetical protein
MQMSCVKCGKRHYAKPCNLKRSKTTEETYMCFSCTRKFKHFRGKMDMSPQNKIKYLAYLRVIKG